MSGRAGAPSNPGARHHRHPWSGPTRHRRHPWSGPAGHHGSFRSRSADSGPCEERSEERRLSWDAGVGLTGTQTDRIKVDNPSPKGDFGEPSFRPDGSLSPRTLAEEGPGGPTEEVRRDRVQPVSPRPQSGPPTRPGSSGLGSGSSSWTLHRGSGHTHFRLSAPGPGRKPRGSSSPGCKR